MDELVERRVPKKARILVQAVSLQDPVRWQRRGEVVGNCESIAGTGDAEASQGNLRPGDNGIDLGLGSPAFGRSDSDSGA